MDREKKLNNETTNPSTRGGRISRTRTDISSLKGLVSKTRVDRSISSISSLSGYKERRVYGSLRYTRIRYKVSLYQSPILDECEDSSILLIFVKMNLWMNAVIGLLIGVGMILVFW
jgi:hypothetical protein